MVTRVTGAPAIQEPRAGAAGGPSVDLRSTQVAIQNIRERFRLLEAALNNLIVPEESAATSTTTSSSRAAGPPGAIQFTDAGGGLAGSLSLTWSATNQELTVVGDTYFNGNLYQNGSLLTFVTGIYADGVIHTGLTALQAGAGVTISALTGNVIEISAGAAAGVNSLNALQGDITLQAGAGMTITVLTGNVIELTASAAAGVTSLNALTGPVTLEGDGTVTVTLMSGNVLQLSASAAAGVSSLNAMTGPVTLQAGTNVTITPLTGNVIEISATGTGGGVTSLNTLTGPVTIQGDGTIGVTILSGNVIELSSFAGGGVTSLNYLTGPVTLRGEGILVGYGTGNVIEIRGTLFTRASSPPTGAVPGDRYVNDTNGVLYTWYDDGNSAQWVNFGA